MIGGIARRLSRHRVATASAVGGLALALLVGGAVIADGYERSDQQLGDASVWVENRTERLLGQANTAIAQLSTVLGSPGADGVIVQDADTVAVHTPADNTLSLVDPSRAELTESVPLPAGEPVVVGSGSVLGILEPGEGELWVTSLADAAAFETGQSPTAEIGVDAVAAVDDSGAWAGFSQRASRLVTGGAGQGTRVSELEFSSPPSGAQLTLIGGEPAVYSPASDELWFGGQTRSLGSVVDDPESVRLEAARSADGGLLVAHAGGLIAVDPDRDELRVVLDGLDGAAAAPLAVDGCSYAAWSDGTGVQWCEGTEPATLDLAEMPGTAEPLVASNGISVVASDPGSGRAWALADGGRLIDNWDDFDEDTTVVETERDDLDVPPETEDQQKPPSAVDDEMGVRAGRANLLPVLLNDSDPNGDPLAIVDVEQPSADLGRIEIVADAQKLQLTTRDGASGAESVRYTVSDGRGGTASATLALTVVAEDVNEPPVQQRTTTSSVARDGQVTVHTIEDWVDPESDPVYLEAADATTQSSVSFSPEGDIEFVQGGGDEELEQITLRASDGRDSGEGLVNITVGARGEVPIIAESYTITGYAGTEIVTAPLEAARGGSGELRFTGASTDDEALTLSPNYTDGSLTVLAEEPGTRFVEYSVTDGELTSSGVIRVEIAPVPDAAAPPVVLPVTAFLYLQNTTEVDVLASAYDPGGGVLSVVGTGEVPEGSGIVVENLESRALRVTLKNELVEPVELSVRVSNGQAVTEGVVTLVNVPEPSRLQAPIARDDRSSVRVGEVVDIPVMRNDEQPNGKPFTLDTELVAEPEDGLLVVAQDRLRYLAPDTPGDYTASYRITGTDGQWASAEVEIVVRDIDVASNRPPSAPTVTGRTTAGEATTLSVPLTGVDPDGDAVQIGGISAQPTLGSVTSVDTQSIEYTANPYSTGTDVFEYTLVDAQGASSTGLVRVGISEDAGAAVPPVAMDDIVTTRPGSALTVDPRLNDSDPTGRGLTVTEAEPNGDGLSAEITDDGLALVAPEREGTVAVLYTVATRAGGTSSAWVFVEVDRDAPLAAPVASDVQLRLADINGREEVPVDVLALARFSEGAVSGLDVTVPSGFGQAEVDGSGRVVVPVAESAQIMPFRVGRPDDPSVSSTAFIRVPGTADAAPELRPDAPELVVASGEELTIPLAEQVIAAEDREVAVTDGSAVQATQSDGSELVADARTLRFRSAEGFWGVASITATVTDGRTQSTLTMPITVTPAEDQPPVLADARVGLEAGTDTTIDLSALTDYASTAEGALSWSVDDSGSAGVVSASVSGSILTVTAVDGTEVGGRAELPIAVEDRAGQSDDAVVRVDVVRSTRPVVSPVADEVVLVRGESDTVDVLANDEASNPFPGRALRVVSVSTSTGLDGVSATPSADRRRVQLSAAEQSETGTMTLRYTVADITDDPDRYATGTVSVRIQDVPDAPGAPRIAARHPEDAAVTLRIPHAFPNASPVTGYRVLDSDGDPVADCENPDSCRVEGIPYGESVSFRAEATNAVGTSGRSPASESLVMDGSPGTPRSVGLEASNAEPDGRVLRASWQAPESAAYGTPVRAYEVRLRGPGVDVARTVTADEQSVLIRDGGIRPGSEYTVSVTARNATNTSEKAGSASAVAVGPPSIAGASAARSGDGDRITVAVTFSGVNGNGRDPGIQVSPMTSADGEGTSCTVGDVRPNASGGQWVDTAPSGDSPRYTVDVTNGLFCVRTHTDGLSLRPNVASARVDVAAPNGDGDALLQLSGLRATEDGARYSYSVVDAGSASGQWSRPQRADGGTITISDGSRFGRATDVYVRACSYGFAGSCGQETKVSGSGAVPLRTLVAVERCTIGQPVDQLVRMPDNNGRQGTIRVRYLDEEDRPLGEFVAPTDPVPAAAEGQDSVRVLTEIVFPDLGGARYVSPEPVAECEAP
ncbi:Ig-like domain-containing protein [Mycetocola reblochoni]|uniref:Ig-like domain-containing protein n=1 Tax=Mycetocola reblochoni TaxID=331618 RepID=UPI003F9A7D15